MNTTARRYRQMVSSFGTKFIKCSIQGSRYPGVCSTLAAGLKETKKRRRSKGEAEAAIRSISKFGGKKHCNPAQHSDGGEQKTNVKEKKVEDEAGAAEGELKLEVEAGDNIDTSGQGDEGEQKISATVEKRIKQDSNEIKKGLGKPKDGAANAVQGAGGDYSSTGVRQDGGQDIIIWEKVDNQWCELKLETGGRVQDILRLRQNPGISLEGKTLRKFSIHHFVIGRILKY